MKKLLKLLSSIILLPIGLVFDVFENIRGRGSFGWYERNNPYPPTSELKTEKEMEEVENDL